LPKVQRLNSTLAGSNPTQIHKDWSFNELELRAATRGVEKIKLIALQKKRQIALENLIRTVFGCARAIKSNQVEIVQLKINTNWRRQSTLPADFEDVWKFFELKNFR
jgi:hypothetical protein